MPLILLDDANYEAPHYIIVSILQIYIHLPAGKKDSHSPAVQLAI
jgi:hypothetical protein